MCVKYNLIILIIYTKKNNHRKERLLFKIIYITYFQLLCSTINLSYQVHTFFIFSND